MAEWQEVPERGSLWSMRLGFALMNLLGYRVTLLLGSVVCLYFFLTGSVSRRASRQYHRHLRAHHGDTVPAPTLLNALRHHWSFTVSIIDRLWFWQGKLDQFQFTSHGKEHVLDREGGLLLLGAHLGSFDAMRAFSGEKEMKLSVVMYRENARMFNQLLAHINPEAGLRIFELGDDNPDQIFALEERLQNGELLAILADRPPPRGRRRLTPLPFLDREAPFPQGPWILASLLDCPVVMINCLRVGFRRYHIEVCPIAERIDLPRKHRQERLRETMAIYVAELERLCGAYPHQWFNFYDFWAEPHET